MYNKLMGQISPEAKKKAVEAAQLNLAK